MFIHVFTANCNLFSTKLNSDMISTVTKMSKRLQWKVSLTKNDTLSWKILHFSFLQSDFLHIYIYFAHGPVLEKISSLGSCNRDHYIHSMKLPVPQHADKEPKDLNMCKQLERLALKPQRWGLTGKAEECLRLCVFCLIWWFFGIDCVEGSVEVQWLWAYSWRRRAC